MDAIALNAGTTGYHPNTEATSRFDIVGYSPRTRLMIILAAALAPWGVVIGVVKMAPWDAIVAAAKAFG